MTAFALEYDPILVSDEQLTVYPLTVWPLALGHNEADGTPVELEEVDVAVMRASTVAKVVPGAETLVLLSIEPKYVQTEPSNAVPTHEVL